MGCWGEKEFRGEKAQPLQYEKARLMSACGASRRHPEYLFHLTGEHEERKITQSIFSTLKNVPGLGSVSVGNLINMIKDKNPILMNRMNRVLKNVPNTAAYWDSQRAKLKAQILKYGPPTFFVTVSPAEYEWEDLIEYIRDQNSDLENIDQLSPAALLNKDPVLVTTYIHQRFNALLEFLIKAKPLGTIKSYFIRHEYQSRGTVHFHMFIWIDGGPVIGKDSDEDISKCIQN